MVFSEKETMVRRPNILLNVFTYFFYFKLVLMTYLARSIANIKNRLP